MLSSNTPNFVLPSPTFFSANWIGRHPHDNRPRLMVCFGPSLPDGFAALQAGVLGLKSVLPKTPPPVTSVHAHIDQDCVDDASEIVNRRGTSSDNSQPQPRARNSERLTPEAWLVSHARLWRTPLHHRAGTMGHKLQACVERVPVTFTDRMPSLSQHCRCADH